MKRPIIGYGIDVEGDWFARLGCGHCQHVRHKPPFINRPWVTTEEGRRSFLGHELDCVRCDRLELPAASALVLACTAAVCSPRALPAQQMRLTRRERARWARIVPTRGTLRCRVPELHVDLRLTPRQPAAIPPLATYYVEPTRHSRFRLELHDVRYATG